MKYLCDKHDGKTLVNRAMPMGIYIEHNKIVYDRVCKLASFESCLVL